MDAGGRLGGALARGFIAAVPVVVVDVGLFQGDQHDGLLAVDAVDRARDALEFTGRHGNVVAALEDDRDRPLLHRLGQCQQRLLVL